jgi:RNA polymerase sigma-70 factor, ECF subfamily
MPSDDPLAVIAIQQLCQQDLSLIQRILERDRSALSELYDRYAGIIYSVAYHSLDSVEASEEVVMDVFTKIWQNTDRHNADKTPIDIWIFMMARTLIIERVSSKQPQDKSIMMLTRSISVFDLPTTTADVSVDLGISARRSQVLTVLASLSIEQRQVLALFYARGWSHREIAEYTGMAVETVKIWMHLSLAKLRLLYSHSSPIN